MNSKGALAYLKMQWEVRRKAWDKDKHVKLFMNSPILDVFINGKYEEYEPTDEDIDALDWELYDKQSIPNPTLT
jgi:hypothetical protein